MASVFVSYAREDAAKAKTLARALETAAFEVWIDQRIGSGSEFSREIEEALKGAAAVVVLWSANSVESPWVRDEAAEGRDSGRLVPVLLDGCRPPIGFRQFQATDLSRWSGRGRPRQFEDVIAAVRAKAGAPPMPMSKATARKPRLWSRPVGWAVAALAVVAVVASGLFFLNRMGNQPAATLSVALLPFGADASDADARKLAAAAHDAVAHTLSQGAFAVSTIDSAPQGGRAPADFLISGHVTGGADKFVATIRMEETANHVVVFSHQFEEDRKKADDFPELIGAQVASQLSWTAPLIAMERRHSSDPAIIASVLQGDSAGLGNVSDLADYEKSRRLAASAPSSPLAQDNFAFSTAFILDQIPREERADAVAAARRAADRTIELAPEYGGGYIPWCLLHSEQRMIQCEDHLRAGMRADPDNSFVNWFLARLLHGVGRIREAAELSALSLAHDPYMPEKIAQELRMLEAVGRTQEAQQIYDQSKRWWPDYEVMNWRRLSGMELRGDFQAAQRFTREFDPKLQLDPLLSTINSKSLDRTRTACPPEVAENELKGFPCMLALAGYGDLDGAFAIADRLYPARRGRTPADEERIWLDQPGSNMLAFLTAPAAAPMRRDLRYVALAERVGLLEYWRSGRLPDFCQPPQPEPICRVLLKR